MGLLDYNQRGECIITRIICSLLSVCRLVANHIAPRQNRPTGLDIMGVTSFTILPLRSGGYGKTDEEKRWGRLEMEINEGKGYWKGLANWTTTWVFGRR